MAQKTYDGRVMHKRDASANWTSNDPVLLNGEIIIVDTQSGRDTAQNRRWNEEVYPDSV